MSFVRRLLMHRHLAVLICTATLLLKLLVPSGYMIDSSHGRITLTICSGSTSRTMTMEMPGMQSDMPDHGKADQGAETPCAFAGFSAPALSATDPVQLAALIAFVMTVGFASISAALPLSPPWLRPPLRGPPAHL